ncbi:MAG: outer membrane lipoprotein carrier protein LolA [Desulfobacterales bacterium]|nr:outer membrane lipoprotein carrier protein LolA [Desulfobacterales bacterium]
MKNALIRNLIFTLITIYLLMFSSRLFGENLTKEKAPLKDELETIIDTIIETYGQEGFYAEFNQISTLKAMDITDTASGKAWFKKPGKMRWEYVQPDKQYIITNGITLWIYRPDDAQVMIGNAQSYFLDGKGASFLSDIKLIKDKFKISHEKNIDTENFYILKLIPIEKDLEMSDIHLSIAKKNFEITRIITNNFYGDTSIIEFKNIDFDKSPDDSFFTFNVPEGADILRISE